MPRRNYYPPKKEIIGLGVDAELRRRIRDYGASIRDDDGPVSESAAARKLILIGLATLEEIPKKSRKKA